MLIIDVNPLIYAHRPGSHRHAEYRLWLDSLVASQIPYAIPGIVRTGFVRIVTNRRVFPVPTPIEKALAFMDSLMGRPGYFQMEPGERHWHLFRELCLKVEAMGNDVTDAHLAALAIEYGCELASSDGGFAKFPGLRWTHPLGRKGR